MLRAKPEASQINPEEVSRGSKKDSSAVASE